MTKFLDEDMVDISHRHYSDTSVVAMETRCNPNFLLSVSQKIPNVLPNISIFNFANIFCIFLHESPNIKLKKGLRVLYVSSNI